MCNPDFKTTACISGKSGEHMDLYQKTAVCTICLHFISCVQRHGLENSNLFFYQGRRLCTLAEMLLRTLKNCFSYDSVHYDHEMPGKCTSVKK